MNGVILSILNEKERGIIMQVIFRCCSKLIQVVMTCTILRDRDSHDIPQGAVRVELWVGKCTGVTLGDAFTGWNSVSRIMIEEVSRPQS